MEQSGEPLPGGEVTARITAPSGKSELVRLTSAGDEWGEFTGHFTALEAGSHRVRLFCKETGATLEASFFVQGAAAEQVGRPARPEVMEELARVTGRQSGRGSEARRGGAVAGRASRSSALGPPGAALVPSGHGRGLDRAAGRLLGGTEGDWSCIIVGRTSSGQCQSVDAD